MGRRYSLAARRVVRGCRRMAESKEGLGSRSSKVVRQEQAPWVMETLDRQTGLPTHTHEKKESNAVSGNLLSLPPPPPPSEWRSFVADE